MKEKGLRERQRRFADFYLECGNASEAARRAGYKPDYGWRLLRDEGVKQFLAGRLEAMDDKRVADAGEVLKYLTSVLRGEAGEELKSPHCADARRGTPGKEIRRVPGGGGRGEGGEGRHCGRREREMRVRLSGLIAEPFRNSTATFGGRKPRVLAQGRARSGKSSFIALEILLGLLADREVNAIVYRKVAATLRESVYEQLLWAAEKLGIAGNIRARAQPLELCYRPTGQRILFRGADDPGKSKSLKIAQGRFGFLWLEELTEFASMDDVRSIKASVLRGEGRSVTFASYNPPMSPANWVNEEVLRPVLGRKVHMSDYRDLPREWLTVERCVSGGAARIGHAPLSAHVSGRSDRERGRGV